jgi:hypothetical protein
MDLTRTSAERTAEYFHCILLLFLDGDTRNTSTGGSFLSRRLTHSIQHVVGDLKHLIWCYFLTLNHNAMRSQLSFFACILRFCANTGYSLSCFGKRNAQRFALTGAGARVDTAWEQEKLEARKMLVSRADSHQSGAPP